MTPHFRKRTSFGVLLLEWVGAELEQQVIAVFSTRIGGVSTGSFAELNLSASVGDTPAAVAENRARYFRAAGVDGGEVVCARQVHGNRVLPVDQMSGYEHLDFTATGQPVRRIGTGDGLITSHPGRFLLTFHADCAPIYLVEPVARVVGLVHAGWRGTVAGAAAAGVEEVCRLGGRRDRILAAIGPAIGPCCYEIDEPVIDKITAAFGREATDLLQPGRPGHSFFDLWEANRRHLLASGVKEEHITIARLCTACNPDLFYSYRRDQGASSGRMAALIGIRP